MQTDEYNQKNIYDTGQTQMPMRMPDLMKRD